MTQPAPHEPWQPQYAQPQHAQQQSAPLQSTHRPATQHAEHPSAQSAPDRPRKALAMVAIAFAVLAALIRPIQAVVTMAIISGGSPPSTVGIASAATGIIVALLSLGALGFGLASVLRRERPRVLAGVAIGVGAIGLIAVLSAGIQTVAYSMF